MTFGSVIRILVVGCLVGPGVRPIPTHDATKPTACGGFSVRKGVTGVPVVPPGVKQQFQEVITNNGGWDQETNVFTALCDGPYFFTFSAISPQKDQDFMMALMKGDQYQVMGYGTKNGYQTGTNSALLDLKIGDEVHLQLQQGMIYEQTGEEAYTSFTGFPEI